MTSDPFEPDASQCPQCAQRSVITENEACILPYGSYPDVVKLIFVMPMRRCLKCGLIFTDYFGEKAQDDALALYRRVLSPTPNIKRWIENVRDRVLGGVPPHVIEQVITAWEIYRKTMEAGTGIEPVRSGI